MEIYQLEQLKAMSRAGRISHYLKLKIAGQITAEKYEECIAFALSLEDTSANEEGAEMGRNLGQTDDVRELEQTGSTVMDQGGERCAQTGKPASEERSVTQV